MSFKEFLYNHFSYKDEHEYNFTLQEADDEEVSTSSDDNSSSTDIDIFSNIDSSLDFVNKRYIEKKSEMKEKI